MADVDTDIARALGVQWFPVLQNGVGTFLRDGVPTARAGAIAEVTITLDTFPYLVYGARFEVSYELPGPFFAANPAYKQQMALGGVVDDFDVEITLTQGNVTTGRGGHCRNIQGALGINKHPWPVFYPMRGGNRVQITARRNSSFAPVVVADVEVELTLVLKVTLETARGIRNTADGVTTPAPPPSTGFP